VNLRLLKDSSLLVAAAFYGVLLKIAWEAGLFGLWLGILLLPSLWRYGFAVLRAAAQGRHNLPAIEIETMNPVGEWRILAHFVAFSAALFLLLSVRPFGDAGLGVVLNWTAACAVAVVFPASAAMMGLTGSFEAAFSPTSFLRVVKFLGAHYFVLVAACLGLWLAAEILMAYVFPRLGILSGIAGSVLTVWALLATFSLTGVHLHEHRNDLAIPGDRETDEERRIRLQRREWQKVLDLAYASIRSGLVAEGYATLHRLSAQHNDSLEIRYWLLENMLAWEDTGHALQVAMRLIERHVADGDLYAALELFTRCRRYKPDFAVAPQAAGARAAFARSIGRHGLADELVAASG
jgi:hypothetical protein